MGMQCRNIQEEMGSIIMGLKNLFKKKKDEQWYFRNAGKLYLKGKMSFHECMIWKAKQYAIYQTDYSQRLADSVYEYMHRNADLDEVRRCMREVREMKDINTAEAISSVNAKKWRIKESKDTPKRISEALYNRNIWTVAATAVLREVKRLYEHEGREYSFDDFHHIYCDRPDVVEFAISSVIISRPEYENIKMDFLDEKRYAAMYQNICTMEENIKVNPDINLLTDCYNELGLVIDAYGNPTEKDLAYKKLISFDYEEFEDDANLVDMPIPGFDDIG